MVGIQVPEKVSYFVHDPSPATRSNGAGSRAGVDGERLTTESVDPPLTCGTKAPNLSETIRVISISRPFHEDQNQTIRRGPVASGFTNKFKEFLRFS